MINIFKQPWFLPVAIVVGVLWGTWCSTNRIIYVQERRLAIHIEAVYNSGVKAKRHGVTSEANPYVYTNDRTRWLNGWMETKRKERP